MTKLQRAYALRNRVIALRGTADHRGRFTRLMDGLAAVDPSSLATPPAHNTIAVFEAVNDAGRLYGAAVYLLPYIVLVTCRAKPDGTVELLAPEFFAVGCRPSVRSSDVYQQKLIAMVVEAVCRGTPHTDLCNLLYPSLQGELIEPSVLRRLETYIQPRVTFVTRLLKTIQSTRLHRI